MLDNGVRSQEDYPEISYGNSQPFDQHWTSNGFIPLTNAVNSYISSKACVDSGTCSDINSDPYQTTNLGAASFPNEEYETTGFWAAIGSTFSLWMIIVLLYPISNSISQLVREKESKLREGMMMMALRGDAYWVSWWFNFVSLFLPLSLILTLVGSSLFYYSDFWLIFAYFFVFFLSAVAYAIFISTFFTNSRTASIVGSLVFFGGFFVYVGLVNPTNSTIIAACLHPATAFTFATLAFAEYEDTAIGVTSYTWNTSNDYNVTFQECLNMLFFDSLIMLTLAWYFDKVWPSDIGTQEPFYFVFQTSYWKKVFKLDKRKHVDHESTQNNDNIEDVDESLTAQIAAGTCIDVKNLYKEFATPHGGKKVAVDGLNVTMFSGQITALLGHNGAGKTTAISMLTGLVSPDAGTATIEGVDITENMDMIRRNLGVCPQHDVLFPELTVYEHLVMFASFKGVHSSEIEGEVDKMVKAVGLTEKKNVASSLLSGGQKRKLSVSIAFIGGSRVVFLDEPTSGMDPYSRRFTWNIIRQYKEGRIVVLTTHFMDEADLLGDRIAIMGDGRLICCGSSLYLKNRYGVGYSLTLEKKDAISFDSNGMTKVVRNHLPTAILLTDVGTEMTWQLPFSASSIFPTLFLELDDNMDKLGLASYGMSVTTLEEVFIKITRSTHTGKVATDGKTNNEVTSESISANVDPMSNNNTPAAIADDSSAAEPLMIDSEGGENAVFVAPSSKSEGSKDASEDHHQHAHNFRKVPEDQHLVYFFRHMRALLEKRALYFVRDKKAWIFTFIIPFIFLLGGLLIMKYTYPSSYEPPQAISANLYNDGISTNPLPTPYLNAQNNSITYGSPGFEYSMDYDRGVYALQEGSSILTTLGTNYPLIDTDDNTGDQATVTRLGTVALADKSDYEAMMVGGIGFLATASKFNQYILTANFSAIYAVPLYQQLVASATAKNLDSTYSISTSYSPFPDTKREDDEYSNYNVDLVVTFIMLALPFVPASFITYIVREKEVKSKHQQMVSGVGVVAYWLSTFLWDNISFTVTVLLFSVLVAGPVFGDDTTQLGGGGSEYSTELGCFIGLMFLFGTSMTGFTYLVSFFFKQPAMAQICMIFVTFILGLVGGIVGIVLRILTDTRDPYEAWIQYLLCLFPPFALADGLHNMALISIWSNLENNGVLYKVTHWRITGLHMMMMGWETVVFLGLTILIEWVGTLPKVQRLLECRNGPLPEVDEALKDDDVIAQEKEIESGAVNSENSVIFVEGLKKMYRGGKYAVKGISLGIPNGECFGLLGINGAGKSSTLAMLSGEFGPSDGKANLAGLDLYKDIHACRRKIGYCPQFDALFELLTAREHLELYARIKGIDEEDIKRVVDAKIREMGLTEYADRYAGTYSGGNKRKLSVAIAMIGEPSIVFLDEPSTGMDPVARRFMWDVISDIVTKREMCSLILTTHSMEECEALCTRIGIMVGGVMRCLGSAQRLRSKYGKGYQIEMGLEIPQAHVVTTMCKEIETKGAISTGELLSTSPPAGGSEEEHVTNLSDLPFYHFHIGLEQIKDCFTKFGKPEWCDRLRHNASGSDLVTACESQGGAGLRHVASWMILETHFDAISSFLTENFTSYIMHERQPSKLRIEIPSELPNNGGKLKLSSMFKAVESKKTELHIESYSMAQTSLEQIFNFFAQQQEEEQGSSGTMAG